jgi:hypothetical protein
MKRFALAVVASIALAIPVAAFADDPPCVENEFHHCPCVDNEFHHCVTAVENYGFKVAGRKASWHTGTETNILGFWLYRIGLKPRFFIEAFGTVTGHNYRFELPVPSKPGHVWRLQVVKR